VLIFLTPTGSFSNWDVICYRLNILDILSYSVRSGVTGKQFGFLYLSNNLSFTVA
jgi:hypothetical protein